MKRFGGLGVSKKIIVITKCITLTQNKWHMSLDFTLAQGHLGSAGSKSIQVSHPGS